VEPLVASSNRQQQSPVQPLAQIPEPPVVHDATVARGKSSGGQINRRCKRNKKEITSIWDGTVGGPRRVPRTVCLVRSNRPRCRISNSAPRCLIEFLYIFTY
jgi:hypothetical protein